MKRFIKKIINRIPIFKKKPKPFPGSAAYWENRYLNGGDSGVGSYGFFAEFKAEVLNKFVTINNVRTVIEFGCGDGNQLTMAKYPSYIGFDISSAAILKCRETFRSDPNKSFHLIKEYNGEKADLAISLDVIFHLVEDQIFENYMRRLFNASNCYVIIYSSDSDNNQRHDGDHVKHRAFTTWVQMNLPDWRLQDHLPNRYQYQGDYRKGSFSEFFIYEKITHTHCNSR
jgi:hypothetical protein